MVNRERFQEVIAEVSNTDSPRTRVLKKIDKELIKYLCWDSAWEQENMPIWLNYSFPSITLINPGETIATSEILTSQQMMIYL